MFTEVYCIVSGRVHGVGFRAFVETVAREAAVTGWVKNNRETGTVEVLFQGLPDTLKQCVEALHQGSVLSRVESVAVDWRTPREQRGDFQILPS
jgi:acylphosphatase